MIIIKTLLEAENEQVQPEHRTLLLEKVQSILDGYGSGADGDHYDAEADGYLVYFNDPGDVFDLSPLGLEGVLTDLVFEGGQYHSESQCHEVIRVTNNSFAMTFIIPDGLLSDEVRGVIVSQY